MSSKLDYLSKYTQAHNDSDTYGRNEKEKKSSKKHKKKRSKSSRSTNNWIREYDNDADLPPVNDNDDDYDDDDEEDRPAIVDINSHGIIAQSDGNLKEAVASPVHDRMGNSMADSRTARKRYDSDSDSELPSRKRFDSEDEHRIDNISEIPSSPKGRRRYDSDDEEPRIPQHVDSNQAANQKHRYDLEDERTSVIKTEIGEGKYRRSHHDSDQDLSISRRRRYDSDDDNTEPTNRDNSVGENNIAQTRRKRRYDTEDEEEEHSKGKKHSRVKHDADDKSNIKPRRKHRNDSDDDDKSEDSRVRMSSGHAAGLQQAGEFRRAEIKIQKAKNDAAQAMVDRHGMGETVYRNDLGTKVEGNKHKKKSKLDPREQALLNKGRAQKEEEARRQIEFSELKESSFARSADDENMNKMFKDEVRDGDPMAMHSKPRTVSNRPVYKGPSPKPNRYGIRPGYRWDGVDRGNGFEDKVLTQKFSSQRKKEDSYRWSSADM